MRPKLYVTLAVKLGLPWRSRERSAQFVFDEEETPPAGSPTVHLKTAA